ncbi:MAG: hypothetical protein ABSG53_05860 [Thermoguttaceae bacterium]|jgi:hypothetical protein
MGLRFFMVPVHDSSAFEEELNGFLNGHKVVSIDRQLIDQGINSFWAICVGYLSHAPGETGHNPNLSHNRVDYKTILSPDEFVVFSRLRELRKELAQPVRRETSRKTTCIPYSRNLGRLTCLRRSPPPPQRSSILARVGVPHRRRQGLVGRPDFRGPELAWHVEDAAVHNGEVARYKGLLGPVGHPPAPGRLPAASELPNRNRQLLASLAGRRRLNAWV